MWQRGRKAARRASTCARVYDAASTLGDVIEGDARNNRIEGGAGDDGLVGQGGDDQLFGGDGNDRLYPGPGNEDVDGGPGRDLLDLSTAGARAFIVDLNVGLYFHGVRAMGAVSIEEAVGGAGADLIFGSKIVANRIDGGPGGAAILYGGIDQDVLVGIQNARGSVANNIIDGGAGFGRLPGNTATWLATDALTGAADAIRIIGAVHPSDWAFAG